MSIYSSKISRNFFGTEEMRQIFSDEARIARFVQVEVALAKVEAELGIIPRDAYLRIAERSPSFTVDWERLRRDVEAVGYPVMPFLKQLTEHCGDAGEYLHWGSTTRDITDTSFVLQVGEGLSVLDRDLAVVKATLVRLVREHRETVMIARTHGMHALPTTFGFRAAVWLAEVHRQSQRLDRLRESFVVGQFGGAVGTLAALGTRGLEVQAGLMRELGLRPPEISWFASRDRVAELAATLALLSATMASIGNTILIMTRDEVREAREPDVPGRGTSSAMPHKHNAVGSELVLVSARVAAQNAALTLESMVQDYDRDWQGHLESIAIPQSFLVTHSAVKQMGFVLAGLHIFPERMRENMELNRGLIMAENVMMALAPTVGRKQAHQIVSAACDAAMRTGHHLKAIAEDDPAISELLTPQQIATAFDPASYLGTTLATIDQVLAACS